ncbi:MAG: DUF2905 family protein [Burkholderiaceae bacterium]|jgi:hypothetical protein|nr:DUF2905 domain-containing protein [Burkholderiaceae bacterium]MBU6292397.1 DUF2905 family protein [Burkholderiales bacterium]NDG07230.1 DUF2905 domain-containing protein [Oxalobacteraceae bacterium]
MRWFIVIFLALVLLSSLLPWLERMGLGRLPGDLNFSIFGWKIRLPFASTLVLTAVFLLLGRLI